MRPPGHGDVIAAARLLRTRPEQLRHWALMRLIAEAEAADKWCLAGRGLHPTWGDGSLMTAALRRGPLPCFGPADREYCGCLALVARALSQPGRSARRTRPQPA